MTSLPLEGIKIVDASRVLAGPFCTTVLSDLGASIIKIEDPLNGDETRHYGPFIDGVSSYFMSVNRNKTGVRLDLKNPEDRKRLYKLVRESHVFIHNFTPETEEKLGVGFDELKKHNGNLIYISISGYGREGPSAGLPAYDIVIQAESGLMSVTGCDENSVVRVGNSTSDIYAGYQCAISALSYLLVNRNGGKDAVHIDISLLDSTLYSMTYLIPYFSAENKSPKALGISHPGIVPYQRFRTTDDDIIIAVANDRQWSKFSRLFDLDSEENKRLFSKNEDRVRNREILVKLIQSRIINLPSNQILDLLKSNGVPAGRINNIEKMIMDPQVKHQKSVMKVSIGEREVAFASFPPIVNGQRLNFYRKPPPI